MTARQQYAIGITIFAAFVILLFVLDGRGGSGSAPAAGTPRAGAEAVGQVVEVTAKGGYQPRTQKARANLATTLRMQTNGTFDCSLALVIPTLGIRKTLPPSGSTDFAIPPQAPGTKLSGTCSMGMYGFDIEFE